MTEREMDIMKLWIGMDGVCDSGSGRCGTSLQWEAGMEGRQGGSQDVLWD